MAVADITLWMMGLIVFNYLLVYRTNKFFGSLGYLVIGGMLIALRTEFGYTQEIYGLIGFFIMAFAMVGVIYQLIGAFRGKV